MRTFLSIGLLALSVGLSPAMSFEGAQTSGPCRHEPFTPLQFCDRPEGVFAEPVDRGTSRTFVATEQAIVELEDAAERGVPSALWKLGRMYADGDGVQVNKARAYEYFRRLTMTHGENSLGTANAPYVANAFVALGQYYLDGIPGVLKADPARAVETFRYAGSYFADPEAQYHLGRLYRSGKGVQKDPIQAARWLRLSAKNGDHRAQAVLGEMLFKGDGIPQQAGLGLCWLIIAKDSAGPDEGWITEMYSSALAQANESDRALAHTCLEEWLKGRL